MDFQFFWSFRWLATWVIVVALPPLVPAPAAAPLIVDTANNRLWIDVHCYKEPDLPCQSRPDELHSLESKGITSISLVWDATYRVDDVGNLFRFYTRLNPEAETTPRDEKGNSCCDLHQRSKDPRLVFDVYLKTVQ